MASNGVKARAGKYDVFKFKTDFLMKLGLFFGEIFGFFYHAMFLTQYFEFFNTKFLIFLTRPFLTQIFSRNFDESFCVNIIRVKNVVSKIGYLKFAGKLMKMFHENG